MRRILAALCVLVLLGGCAKPPEAPNPLEAPKQADPSQVGPSPVVAPQPPPAPPTEVSLCLDRAPTGPAGLLNESQGIWVGAGTCRVKAHADPLTVSFSLPPEVDEQLARDSLKGGFRKVTFQRQKEKSWVIVEIPEGLVGETTVIRLQGPVGPGGAPVDMGFAFERMETPRVMAEIRQGESDWVPLVPGDTVPAQPLQFRFRFSGAPDRTQVRKEIEQTLQGSQMHIEETDSHMVVDVANPPARLQFSFDHVAAAHQLKVRRSMYVIYTGAPPSLMEVNPATGSANAVGTVPVDVRELSLSPDGKWAMLSALAPDHDYREQIWVMNTVSGERWLTPFVFGSWIWPPTIWLPDRLILPFFGRIQVWYLAERRGEIKEVRSATWETVSPDKRYLAGFTEDYEREDKSGLAPASIVIHDLTEGTDRVLTDLTRVVVPHSEKPPTLGMGWAPDGQSLLIEDLQKFDRTGPSREVRWLQVNLSTTDVTPYNGNVPHTVPYSPWIAGPGGWEGRQSSEWGPVEVKTPDGVLRTIGEGRFLGWSAKGNLLVLRWENAKYRRIRSQM